MKRAPRLLVFLTLLLAIASAQTAKVKQNVVLRTDASSSSDRITTLKPPATLTLVKPASKDGFLHVTTADGQTGWVWAKFIEVQDDGDSEDTNVVSKLLAAHTEASVYKRKKSIKHTNKSNRQKDAQLRLRLKLPTARA
jgi:uncharacterized protein YgiM (DUF1202 family)